MRIATSILSFAVLCLVWSAAPRAQSANPLAPLGFLIGTWDALPDATGNTGRCAFTPSLQGQVIVRTNHADTKATATQPASSHDDLMVIYVDGGVVKADYWDNEKHLIHYVVQPRGSNEVVFTSEPTASAPGYRLTYALQPDGTVKGVFEFAQPGKPGAWSTYLAWGMKPAR